MKRLLLVCFLPGATACSSAGSHGAQRSPVAAVADAGVPLDSVQTSIGPIDVPSGVEKTVCIVKSLGNADDFVATTMTGDLRPGSHHLIAYRTSDTQENLTPTDCQPFAGIAIGQATPLIVVTESHVVWNFPSGVGLRMQPNQMLRIEAHYLNATTADLQGQGTVTFQGKPLSAAPPFQEAEVLVWGTQKISIPPQSTFSTGIRFQAGAPGMHFFSVSTHEHRLGTRMQVWSSAAPGDTSIQLADDTDWSNPYWRMLDSIIDFDGYSGLSYQCDWANTTDQAVSFGESALNEMCFILGYYYPSNGRVDFCLDGNCIYRSLDGGGVHDG